MYLYTLLYTELWTYLHSIYFTPDEAKNLLKNLVVSYILIPIISYTLKAFPKGSTGATVVFQVSLHDEACRLVDIGRVSNRKRMLPLNGPADVKTI